MSSTSQNLLKEGKLVIEQEARALQILAAQLDENYEQVCQLILKIKGKLVVTGMGKSGHIAKKIAATFASTGTPAFFIHPSEALHGDMGMVGKDDLLLAISFSGENEEIIACIPYLKQHHIPWVAVTGNLASTLATASDLHLMVPVTEEACPLGLAPTTSTTATLALGDALAISLLHARGFTKDDFARNHPRGRLGKQLLLTAKDIAFFGDDLPAVLHSKTVAEAIVTMSEKRLGLALVVDEDQKLLGIYTDGDLRRTVELKHDLHKTLIQDVMHVNPITIPATCPLSEALSLMNDKRVTSLIVRNNDDSYGVLRMHSILDTGAFS